MEGPLSVSETAVSTDPPYVAVGLILPTFVHVTWVGEGRRVNEERGIRMQTAGCFEGIDSGRGIACRWGSGPSGSDSGRGTRWVDSLPMDGAPCDRPFGFRPMESRRTAPGALAPLSSKPPFFDGLPGRRTGLERPGRCRAPFHFGFPRARRGG